MSDSDKCKISRISARYASWSLEMQIRKKRKLLQELVTENDPDFKDEFNELKEDIELYESAFKEIRKSLDA